ncbi:hypothetical protein GYMLUDRAFT_242874 [Collybiopsis luxurians FD-317 M1]|uniref:Uncharacterized protein n=1 Tax=Collybiopsis luxurians FD-317 M1 TaxID=944289 RepID=A0A0D0CSB2_9AGAR|nr:hypothetical protein GYMLUDRAFT_242874 [Collybiopsis luxurians FD-317 M1]
MTGLKECQAWALNVEELEETGGVDEGLKEAGDNVSLQEGDTVMEGSKGNSSEKKSASKGKDGNVESKKKKKKKGTSSAKQDSSIVMKDDRHSCIRKNTLSPGKCRKPEGYWPNPRSP